MKKTMILALVVLLATACEKEIDNADTGNVSLTFVPTTADVHTRGSAWIGDFFTKLNVMLFDGNGEKVLSQVKTQTINDADFGTINIGLSAGTYTVVAVGHSSIKSATIKSPELVLFTASDGEKLTDTFCYCGKVTVTNNGQTHELVMNRATAMLQFKFTDNDIPQNLAKIKIDYSGGSANFNPSTMEGCTKSNQSESRPPASVYQCFTFPYMAKDGVLKVTVSALDDNGVILRQKSFSQVPVTRNRITTYTGTFFGQEDGSFVQTGFGISVNPKWDGEDEYQFARKHTFSMQGDFLLTTHPMTRSLSADGKNMTDVYVLDYVNNELQQQIHQTSEDDDFGTPSLTLTNGTHHLYFIASRGGNPSLDTSTETITWAPVRDTFWKDYEISVTPSGSTNHSVTLDRIVTKLKVNITDKVPTGCSTLTITPTIWYVGINYTTGNSVAQQQSEQTVSVPSNYIGTSGEISVNIFGFSAATQWTTDFSLTAKNANNEVIASTTITGAPFLRNRVTEYSGSLFSSQRQMAISLNDTWIECITATW